MTTKPQWQPLTDDMPNGWYWVEMLDADQPPQLLRSTMWIECKINIGSMFFEPQEKPTYRKTWQRWTIAGWVPITCRVAPCTGRPE